MFAYSDILGHRRDWSPAPNGPQQQRTGKEETAVEGDLETLQDADEARDEVIRVDAFSRDKALRP